MVGICGLMLLILLPINYIYGLSECKYRSVFNFGDSNSDTGGLAALFGEYVSLPPNGETYFHSPAGRASDGRLIIDFLAQDLGLPFLSPILDSTGTNFSHGANFATMGSSIRIQNTTIYQSGFSPVSLGTQYMEFSYFMKRSKIARERGDIFKNLLPEESKFSSALYTFDIGQNDLNAGFQLNMSMEQVKAYIPDVISQFTDIIKKVYASGGRTFWIHNTGPVGCLPYVMDSHPITKAQVDKHGCADPFNKVSQYFNQKLKEAVIQLRKDLPSAAITYVDIYSVKYSLIANSKKLGFGDPFLTCTSSKMVKGKRITLTCKDPSLRIIWDRIHFTEAASKWIYAQIATGTFSDPPVPLKMACLAISKSEDISVSRKIQGTKLG